MRFYAKQNDKYYRAHVERTFHLHLPDKKYM